jgi:hypothetical protein
MADRFPSLEEFDSGGTYPPPLPNFKSTNPSFTAQTQAQGSSTFESADADDFLTREKALLGDDANQFATGNDNAAFVEDGDDDLLGGGGGEEVTEFESSFPAIDSQNEACSPLLFPPHSSNFSLSI